jgi:MFS family permease
MFAIKRNVAMAELLQVAPTDPLVKWYTGIATSILMIGWATGGIFFGILGDRLGRAKTMVMTILMFSVFTGMISLAPNPYWFIFFQFMTGLGVGGQFAVGVSLVAEVMPDRARPHALGMLQAFSTLANVLAAVIGMGFGTNWRPMFAVGVVPALLAVLVMTRLKEPERWQKARAEGDAKKSGSLVELFGTPRWRNNAIVGLLLAASGVIGLWGIGFFSIDLNQSIFQKKYEQQAREAGEAQKDQQFVRLLVAFPDLLDDLFDKAKAKTKIDPKSLLGLEASNKDPQELYAAALKLRAQQKPISPEAVAAAAAPDSPEKQQRLAAYLNGPVAATADFAAHLDRILARQARIGSSVSWWASITSILFNLAAFCGVYTFSRITQRIGRKPAFALSFVAAGISTAVAFLFMSQPWQVFLMVPAMGFCQFLLFGGYAIYFPELFPTRLRSTGTSFCYNIGRYVAAAGPSALGLLTSVVYAAQPEPMRYAGVTMCATFLVGLVVLPFAPETKGQPLPE